MNREQALGELEQIVKNQKSVSISRLKRLVHAINIRSLVNDNKHLRRKNMKIRQKLKG